MLRSNRDILMILGFLLGASGATPAGAAAPAGRPVEIASPSGVLAQLVGRGGGVSFPNSYDAVEVGADRTLAPYFVVVGADSASERLPVKETTADVTIAGVIARVRVAQVFANQGGKPIEAIYVFPASTRAAVHGMRMKVGERVIEAKIDRKEAARQTYEAARREGRRSSLLEQERPNVFTMNVANVMPGDRIRVELDYSELLVPEDGTYEFVYPTVVGPRYGGGADPVRDRFIANPTLPQGASLPIRFDIRVHVETGIPLKQLSSPSHDVKIAYAGVNRADVSLGVPGGGNRDFVLRYRLAGDRVETGALLWEGEVAPGHREGFFAVMMEAPRHPAQNQIPPREYIFLLDVSGSMHGFPLDTAKTLMRNLLPRLRPTDHFNIVLFSGASATMSADGSLPATADNVSRAIAYVDRQQGGGGTELMGGLEASYRIPPPGRNVARTVVVVTDGFVGVEAQAFRFIRERLGEANLFAFGIGSSVNRGLIEGMARAGLGEPFIVLGPAKAAEAAERLRAIIEQPVLTNIKVAFHGLGAYEIAPAQVPDLMARRPLVVYGKFRGAANGRIVVTGETGSGHFEQAIEVRTADVREENAALRWLWARKWVEILDDERHMGGGQPIIDAITNLGLGYSMLTAFTSFVAVDSMVVNRGGIADPVKQPLPLPEGLSNLAVGGMATEAAAPSPLRAAPPSGSYPVMKEKRSVADDPLGGLTLDGASGGAGIGAVGSASGRSRLAQRPSAPAEAKLATAEEGSVDREADKKKPGKDDARGDISPGAEVTVTRTVGLGDTRGILAQIRAALVGNLGSCHAAVGRSMNLSMRFTVDGAGRAVKVELLRGSAVLFGCVHPALAALGFGNRAPGVLEVRVRLL